jgi:hypothetical protein
VLESRLNTEERTFDEKDAWARWRIFVTFSAEEYESASWIALLDIELGLEMWKCG